MKIFLVRLSIASISNFSGSSFFESSKSWERSYREKIFNKIEENLKKKCFLFFQLLKNQKTNDCPELVTNYWKFVKKGFIKTDNSAESFWIKVQHFFCQMNFCFIHFQGEIVNNISWNPNCKMFQNSYGH